MDNGEKTRTYFAQMSNTPEWMIKEFRKKIKKMGYVNDSEFWREKMREVIENE